MNAIAKRMVDNVKASVKRVIALISDNSWVSVTGMHFHIIAFSNVCFMIKFIVSKWTGGENAMMFCVTGVLVHKQ